MHSDNKRAVFRMRAHRLLGRPLAGQRWRLALRCAGVPLRSQGVAQLPQHGLL